jgi:hypothetical protein
MSKEAKDEALKLVNEYRPSMNSDLLHLWAKDMQVVLKAMLATPPAAKPAPEQPVAWTEFDLSLIDGLIYESSCAVTVWGGESNRELAGKQKGFHMDRVALLKKIKATLPAAPDLQAVPAIPMHRIADVESAEIDDMRPGRAYREGWNKCRAAMLAAAQPEQEPVAWIDPADYATLENDGWCVVHANAFDGSHALHSIPPAAAQPAQQEPVAFYVYEWINPSDGVVFRSFRADEYQCGRGPDRTVAVPTPPAAQRKPLTDEWIHRTTVLMGFNPEWTTEIGIAHAIVRAAEAAHGIK